MFTREIEDFFGREKIRLINKSSGEYVSIIPAFGGNLNELALSAKGHTYNIIDGDKELGTLYGSSTNFYRGAKLSPFPNRVNNGKYEFAGNEYHLEKNAPPHALHGLCWNLPFALQESTVKNNSVQVILQADYKALNIGFPFSYHIEIEYTLEDGKFKCLTRIVNTSEYSIPIADGWHPYFTTGSKINTLKLQLPLCRQVELDKTLIPTGKYLPNQEFETPTILNDMMLDHCFELDKNQDIAQTRLIDKSNGISILIWQKVGDRGYNFIQLYTPPDRNSIAIEPMTCSPDAFNNKNGLIVLSPGESVEFTFGVSLEVLK
ncbi:MAG TPA: aldose 1-epimerase [Bacteroidia bacterium]|jgi:aldose 1-epimerase|nr:aldose 1-epimerase [Bacteroidia bacterium]